MSKNRRTLKGDQALLQALQHPLRRSFLKHCIQTGREESPSDYADAQQLPVSNVAYHVRELSRLGALDLVRTAPTRGSVEHFYKAAKDVSEKPWALEILGLAAS